MSRRRNKLLLPEPEAYPGFHALVEALHGVPATCWDPTTTGRYVSDIVGMGGENHPPHVAKMAAILAAVTELYKEQLQHANKLRDELNDLHRDIEGVGRLVKLAEHLSSDGSAG